MRSLIAILLLLLFTSQTELGQFFRLPFAVQHYLGHRQEKESLSLLDFLAEHYNNSHNDEDWASDSQLPFKSYNSEMLSLVYVPAAPADASLQPVQTSQKPFTLFVKKEPCRRSFSIFHPPQAM